MNLRWRKVETGKLGSIIILILISSLTYSWIYISGTVGDEDDYAVRRVVWDYVKSMNRRSVDEVVSLYTVDGEFVDMTFNVKFSGPDQLRNLYRGIFEVNPRLTFTAFPWGIQVSLGQASVTCSWSLVGEYGTYNGVYLINMIGGGGTWRILKVTSYITVIHYYHPPNILIR
ncbi:MAG: YybH family protein [Candidatus Bathyarchaeia archaeon]